MRAVVSVMPPGVNGTTQVIGRLGKSSADAGAVDTGQREECRHKEFAFPHRIVLSK